MTVGSQMPELDRGTFCPPPPYKLGGQNTPYKLGLNEILFIVLRSCKQVRYVCPFFQIITHRSTN